MSSLRHRIAVSLRRFGVSLTRYPGPGSLEHHLAEIIRTTGVELVIDVGAHHGGYGRTLRRFCGYQGEIVSFEPASASIAVLRGVADANWRVHQLALSDVEGTAQLNLFGESLANSLLPPSDYGRTRLDMTTRGGEKVRTRRLDDVVVDLGISLSRQPTLLKIDTQGHDLRVLHGAPEALSAVDVLQVELAALALYEGSPSMLDTLAFAFQSGFDITGLFPIDRDEDMRVFEFDCVLRRRTRTATTTRDHAGWS